MKRDEFEPIPCSPAQRALCEEFAAWAERQGVPTDRGADDPLILNMLSRDQRSWLSNFIARWDWASEQDARAPGALRTPLELAGAIMTVVRENCSRGEFEQIQRGEITLWAFLDAASVVDLAFSRLHRVPIDGARTPAQLEAEAGLKAAAMDMVRSTSAQLLRRTTP